MKVKKIEGEVDETVKQVMDMSKRVGTSQTHVESSDGGRGLVGLHHLRQGPHLLDAG